jgi:hypothetical protein
LCFGIVSEDSNTSYLEIKEYMQDRLSFLQKADCLQSKPAIFVGLLCGASRAENHTITAYKKSR